MHEEENRPYDLDSSKEQPWGSNFQGRQEEARRSCSQR